jgi:chloride channel protein, CIC family
MAAMVKHERLGERQRRPAPLLKRRLPSQRGAVEQPNAAGDGAAEVTPLFWAALVATGVATGLVAVALMALLFHVEHAAFGFTGGTLLAGVASASRERRIASLLIAGLLGGIAWYLLRRFTPGRTSDLDDVVWTARGELSFRRSLGTSVISEVVIGMGASLGREAAPKLMGGAWGACSRGALA